MSVGLDALKIFKSKGTVEMRKKYPSIYREDIDKTCHFNPNDDYLYAPSAEELKNINKQISPWHFLTLVPKVSNYTYKWQKKYIQIHHYYTKPINHQSLLHNKSLYSTLYLMQFLNWAIYYYNRLTDDYKRIPKHPKQEVSKETKEATELYAAIMEEVTGKQLSKEEIDEKVNNAFKRNHFPLKKPPYFLTLCRFFARAWHEQRFSSEEGTVGSVEFAHYVGCYIKNNPSQTNEPKGSYYNGGDGNAKKEVSKLFAKITQGKEKKKRTTKHTYRYNDFDIEIERYDNGRYIENNNNTYTISITQRCKHSFYLFASLYQHRYNSTLK